MINELLHVQDTLGHTGTAFVQSVRCRRILLARKTITCDKNTVTRKDAINEVAHLSRLNHAHIVRIIGTYVKGRDLSILMYPAAEYNLESFFEAFKFADFDTQTWHARYSSANRWYGYLSNAVQHIHDRLTKHMDIKPQNILIRNPTGLFADYYPFIADFGIARSYASPDDVKTDGRTFFTKRYAAPEVIKQDTRGLPADIFSLACVFFELYTNTTSWVRESDFENAVTEVFNANKNCDRSYAANVVGLQDVLASKMMMDDMQLFLHTPEMVFKLINMRPQDRPSAKSLSEHFGNYSCCTSGSIASESWA